MQFQFTPIAILLLAASAVAGWLSFYAWQRRATRGARALAALGAVVTEWVFTYALEIAGADLETKLFWGKCQYLAISLTPALWLFFALTYYRNGKPLSTRSLLPVLVIPAITFTLIWTTEIHHLIWTEYFIRQEAGFSVLGVSYGPWFWVHWIYSNLMVISGTIIVLRKVGTGQRLYRQQAIALVIAALAPWAGNFMYVTRLNPIPGLDLTPVGFTFSIVAVSWAILGFQLIELLPVARELVVEEMQDGIVVLDANNRIADINPAAERIFNLPAVKVVGKPVTEALQRWIDFVNRYLNIMEALDEITIGEAENRRWYELSLSPLYDRRKEFIGRLITIRDITQRRQAEEQVRRLSRAVESSPASIVITDTSGNIQYANPKFVQVTGYSLEEVLGQNPRLLKTDETPAEVHQQLWAAITAGQEWHGEFCNRRKNGERFWESASISPITDHAGRIISFVAVKEDITEQRRMQQQLLRQQEALKTAHDQAVEASQMKTQLLAKVNHELRTSLGGILGYAELLHSGMFGKLSDQQSKAAERIIESSHYLNTLINELLDAAQIESRRLNLRLAECSPLNILHKVETSMVVLAQRKGIVFKTRVDKKLPATIIGDEQRLQQILINLVGNAIKYTEQGEVCLSLLRLDPRRWQIRVDDTGVGIPAEMIPYIFEAFRQADSAITSENRGAGLGLSITHQLVTLMGGDIQVESRLGEGSRFTVTLPLDTVSLAEEMPC